jgi:hypothetical protein
MNSLRSFGIASSLCTANFIDGQKIAQSGARTSLHSRPPLSQWPEPDPAPNFSCSAHQSSVVSGRTRRLLDVLDAPDPYCPVARSGDRKLKVEMASRRELPKLESACTTIVMARLGQSLAAAPAGHWHAARIDKRFGIGDVGSEVEQDRDLRRRVRGGP